MYIYKLRKTTSGGGGNMSHKCSCGGKVAARPTRRVVGNGLSQEVYENVGQMRPSKVLQNIRIKKSNIPKKYITFE